MPILSKIDKNRLGQGSANSPGLSPMLRVGAFTLVCLLILNTLTSSTVASAQTNISVFASPPDFSDFPTIRSTFKVHDEFGLPIQGINASQVTVHENDLVIAINELQEKYSGVHFTLAINADKQLDIRDAAGVSYYEILLSGLNYWQERLSSSEQDLWSLIVNEGQQYIRLNDPNAWFSAISAYQPDMRHTQGSLASLSSAVDLASDASINPEIDQVLLYITPPPELENIADLNTIKMRALQQGLHINVWMVGSIEIFNTDRVQALKSLADETGGKFFLFSGSQTVPDPQNYIYGLGTSYNLSYTSQILRSGTHTHNISITLGEQEIKSPEVNFYIEVIAPNPIFLSPPLEITRTIMPESSELDQISNPDLKEIKVLIEFPDGHPRLLNYVRLYVNDVLVQENTAPPFGKFNWDLSAISKDCTCSLQIQLEDSLGLQSSSLILPVQVHVEYLDINGRNSNFSDVKWLLIGIISFVSLLALSIGIFFILRKSKKNNHPILGRKIKYKPSRRTKTHMLKQSDLLNPSAKFIRLTHENQLSNESPILITQNMVTFGKDPALANCVLLDPSIEPLHAQLQHTPEDKYILADLGSVAGTWVNYAPISKQGTPIENGDLIHIGRMAFRFTINHAPPYRKPKIASLDNQP